MLGAFRVLGAGIRGADDERTRLLAEQVALNRAAELRLEGAGLPGEVTLGGRDWDIATRDAATAGGFVETTILVTPQAGGPGARLVTWRSAP